METVDSTIGSLPAAQSFDDNSLLVAEQSAEAVKVTGAQLKAYASAAGASAAQPYATAAATSAETAAQWATGNTSGTPSATNNGKYYSEQAAGYAATAASWSANPPYIGTNGNWYVWNTTTEQYEDSGVDASITVTIADITELAAGATPYVTNTGTPTDPIFHLFIPAANSITSISKTGTSGLTDTYTITYADGTTSTFAVVNGEDGYNPVVTVTSITGGHTVTITDADHPSGQSFNVMDGDDGVSPSVTISTITGGHRVTITDADHPSGQSFDVLDGTGTGDMQASTYDPQGAVATAGGIPAYVSAQHDSTKQDQIIYRQITLTANGWSSNQQTATVTGISATETDQLIRPVPTIASQAEYNTCGIRATNQAANSLTFTCEEVPSNNLTVYVVITDLEAAT